VQSDGRYGRRSKTANNRWIAYVRRHDRSSTLRKQAATAKYDVIQDPESDSDAPSSHHSDSEWLPDDELSDEEITEINITGQNQ
jgi:hypothetical protein